eukprot:TRINITY_DN21908_c0_g1_i1.p1 TRINITY_DN21908_c0_g1~~TRINITY_DN21908_c0_g1_i1.p1  ORF type:complete len:193 (+),score=13.59 TRINITY_DN21908_c0_g1_i1:60-638(+)
MSSNKKKNREREMVMGAVGSFLVFWAMFQCVAAKTYIVGDAIGWTVPPNTTVYGSWAAKQAFKVGDTLLFNFTTGEHNVAPVRKAGYDACNFSNVVGITITVGPARVLLGSPGEYYYICTVGTHCLLGQKLAINVSGPFDAAFAGADAPSPTPMSGGPRSSMPPLVTGFGVAGLSIAFSVAYTILFLYVFSV